MLTNTDKIDFIKRMLYTIPKEDSLKNVQEKIINFLITGTHNGKLYKYREVNEFAISNLKEGTLFCAKPSLFNDPFDCKIGIDVQSYMSEIYGREFESVEEYFYKFVKVHTGQIMMDDCTDKEKEIFVRWKGSRKITLFIDENIDNDVDDNMIVDKVINNTDVIFEILAYFSANDQIRKEIMNINQILPRVLANVTEEGKQFLNENSGVEDFARSLGITEDGDEISLVRSVLESQFPEKADMAIQLDNDLAEADRKLSEDIDKKYRVGSICTDYRNRLMWSHYADSHKGFCIEYDFSAYCEEIRNMLILPVVYSDTRTKLPWDIAVAKDSNDDVLKNKAAYTMLISLLTKDEIWSYENEWRIIRFASNDDNGENIKMPLISCIYIGALCSEEDKKMLIQIAKEKNISVKQMVVDRGEYILHAKEINV